MRSMYLSSHSSLTQSMRGILIDWLIELTLEYNLSPTTLYHAVSLVDRSLSHLPPVPRAQLQCLGCACMLVSSKLHEIHPPTADDFVYISDSTYTRGQITSTEVRAVKRGAQELSEAPGARIRCWTHTYGTRL